MNAEQFKAELLSALNDEYGEEGWDDLRSLERIATRLVALLPNAALIAEVRELRVGVEHWKRVAGHVREQAEAQEARAERAEAEVQRLREGITTITETTAKAISHENVLGVQVVSVRWVQQTLRALLDGADQ